MYRQGDLLIVAEALPLRELTPLPSGIVQHGEATGHAHRLEGGKVLEGPYLDVPAGGARLTHDEHDTIEIPEGTYRVIRQREYTEGGGYTNVAD